MNFWHLIGRGVDKRDVVMDDQDRVRFTHDLFVLNDVHPVPNYILNERKDEHRKRERLIDIHAFCLMKNHYHLLVSERVENGISMFMHKMNMGYTKYFNRRYERSGVLWQGKYRKVLIERDAHFLYIPFYIHLNPLDYTHPEWRKGEVQDVSGALTALQNYRWSSHLDYFGNHNFPSIIESNEISPVLGMPSEYEQTIEEIISNPDLASRADEIES
ncbi:MAG: transposase [Patescibacteria group bacterium]